MIASVGSTIRGSSRSSTRTSPGPYITAPRTTAPWFVVSIVLVRPLVSPSSPPRRSRLDQDLDRLAVGHRAVAVGHAVEVGRGVHDLPRFDGAVEDVGHQLLDVGADRRGPAGEADVVAEEAAEADRRLL